jgi:hypothetical protein
VSVDKRVLYFWVVQNKKDEMGGAYSAHEADEEFLQNFG